MKNIKRILGFDIIDNVSNCQMPFLFKKKNNSLRFFLALFWTLLYAI